MMLEDLALPWLEDKDPSASSPPRPTPYGCARRKARWPIWIRDAPCSRTSNATPPATSAEGRRLSRQRPALQSLERARGAARQRRRLSADGPQWLDDHREKIYRQELLLLAGALFAPEVSTRGHVFIAHDTEAQVVPEQDFFTLSNSGGTMCSSAYRVALAHLQQPHPKARWNNYVFHFSDGDNLAVRQRRL